MALSTQEKLEVMRNYQRAERDTGSSEVQIALLTRDIEQLTAHLKEHKKDHHSYQGLRRKINRRRKLLAYLKKNSFDLYQKLIQSLAIREI